MRAKAIDVIQDCANKFVHFNANDIPEYVNDLVSSKKWKSIFGISCESTSSEDIFLSNLAAEYKCCKDKEVNKAIRLQVAKQKQKVLIALTLGDSRVSLNGETLEVFKSRVNAAKELDRVRSYADEKRPLLSIVAMYYCYLTLQNYLNVHLKLWQLPECTEFYLGVEVFPQINLRSQGNV